MVPCRLGAEGDEAHHDERWSSRAMASPRSLQRFKIQSLTSGAENALTCHNSHNTYFRHLIVAFEAMQSLSGVGCFCVGLPHFLGQLLDVHKKIRGSLPRCTLHAMTCGWRGMVPIFVLLWLFLLVGLSPSLHAIGSWSLCPCHLGILLGCVVVSGSAAMVFGISMQVQKYHPEPWKFVKPYRAKNLKARTVQELEGNCSLER